MNFKCRKCKRFEIGVTHFLGQNVNSENISVTLNWEKRHVMGFVALKGSHFWFYISLAVRQVCWKRIRLFRDLLLVTFVQFVEFEPPHAKPTKWHLRPAKTQISLGICPIWSESSLSVWRNLGSLAIHWAYSEDSDQTGRIPRLIWGFAGRTCHFVGFVTRRLISQRF